MLKQFFRCIAEQGLIEMLAGPNEVPHTDGPVSCSVAGGAALPLLVTALVPEALLGGVAARVGGARVKVSALCVTVWGALAMGLTAGVGALFGTGA